MNLKVCTPPGNGARTEVWWYGMSHWEWRSPAPRMPEYAPARLYSVVDAT